MANNNISIANAHVIYRNFAGKPGPYNAEGDRNFCVVIHDPVLAKTLVDEGWNVRMLRSKDPDAEDLPYIQVKVSYNARPPKIAVITHRGMTLLEEEDLKMLDWAEFANVDLIINPYHWSIAGRQGVKGYLKAFYATLVEDEFALKYESLDRPPLPNESDLPFDL